MLDKKIINATDKFERALKNPHEAFYILCLYLTGHSPQSVRAVNNISFIFKQNLAAHYDLQVINLQRQRAEGKQIIATPALLEKLPLPLRRIIGDRWTEEKVPAGPDLRPV